MMNQEQYHASLLNKGQPVGLGWDGVTKASQPKAFPAEPPNSTDVEKTIRQVAEDDSSLIDLNWNNIKVIIFCFLFFLVICCKTLLKYLLYFVEKLRFFIDELVFSDQMKLRL